MELSKEEMEAMRVLQEHGWYYFDGPHLEDYEENTTNWPDITARADIALAKIDS